MATNTANLQDTATSITTGLESVVIVDNFQSIRGGRTLDTSAFATANPTLSIIAAGHPIIKETATGNYKPMPIATANAAPYTSGTAFGALPTGHTYEGILINTVLVSKPFAGILVRGTVNPNAMPYTATSILTALKAALTMIDFRTDAQ
jgi:hypothetical protein